MGAILDLGCLSFRPSDIILFSSQYLEKCFSPALKKWGLYWIWVVCHTVIPSFGHNFVFPQYHEKYFSPALKVGAIMDIGCLSFRPSIIIYIEKYFIESN